MKKQHLIQKIIFFIKANGVFLNPGRYYYENSRFKLKTSDNEIMKLTINSLKEDLYQQINDNDIKDSWLEKIKKWDENY